MLSRMKAFQSFEEALDFVQALVLDGAPVILPIANDATLPGQSDPVGAGMAMVLDVFLAKGYEPDGFEQGDYELSFATLRDAEQVLADIQGVLSEYELGADHALARTGYRSISVSAIPVSWRRAAHVAKVARR